MSCFWDGLRAAFRDDLPSDPVEIARYLKGKNIRTPHVLWNGERFSQQQLDENYKHIETYDPSSVRSGYLCSTCDPFLCLVAALFMVRIEHTYISNTMTYESADNFRIVRFKSDRGHFEYVKEETPRRRSIPPVRSSSRPYLML